MASGVIVIQRDRTEVVTVQFATGVGAGYASDTFTSEIHATKDPTSATIATFTVNSSNVASSDAITLTLDNSVTSAITADRGWFDVIRTSGGEPYRVFDEPVQVSFVDVPTAVA